MNFDLIEGAVFDIDGTILDTMPMWMHVSEKYLATLGIHTDEDLDRRFLSATIDTVAVYMKEQFSLELTVEEIKAGIQKVVQDFYFNEAMPKEGIVELIEEFHERKIPMVVASSGIHELIEAALNRLDLRKYFMCVMTGDKTSTGLFEKCMEVLGTDASSTFVFEDGIHAIETAKKMGMKTVAVKDIQDNFSEIRELADYEFTDFIGGKK